MAVRSLFDQLVNSVGNAVTDVREKLVEEAWFGRTTSPQERMSQEVGYLLGQQPTAPEAQGPELPVSFDRLLRQFIPARDADTAPYFDRATHQFSDAQVPRALPQSWAEMTAHLAKARGYESEHEHDKDLER